MDLIFCSEPHLSVADFYSILERSTLAERRPVNNRDRMEGMLKNSDIIITARNKDNYLVGLSRALTDFSYCTYLADLAVDCFYQKQGIGRRLLHETHQVAGLHTTLILLSAPKAQTYYPHIGLVPHNSCWIIPEKK